MENKNDSVIQGDKYENYDDDLELMTSLDYPKSSQFKTEDNL